MAILCASGILHGWMMHMWYVPLILLLFKTSPKGNDTNMISEELTGSMRKTQPWSGFSTWNHGYLFISYKKSENRTMKQFFKLKSWICIHLLQRVKELVGNPHNNYEQNTTIDMNHGKNTTISRLVPPLGLPTNASLTLAVNKTSALSP